MNPEGRESGLFCWLNCHLKTPERVWEDWLLSSDKIAVQDRCMGGNMLNQNQGTLNQFNIKASLLSGDIPTEKLLIVLGIVLFIFLSIVGLIVLKLI